MGPEACLGSTVELVLEVWVRVSQLRGHESRRADPASKDGSIEWPSQNSAGELSLVVRIRERQCADQVGCHSGSDPGL